MIDPQEPNAAAERHRLFVGLPIAPFLVPPLERLQERLGRMPGGGALRWARPDQTHLTLRFLGDVPVEGIAEACQLVEGACRGLGSFTLRLRGVGCFPQGGQPRVLWVGIDGALEALRGVQAAVTQALSGLGDHREMKPFLPHLTIGRVRAGSGDVRHVRGMVSALSTHELGPWPVDEVVVLRSELRAEGARYSRLATVPLSALATGSWDASGSR